MKQEEQLNQIEDTIENGTPDQVQNIAQNAPEPIANEAKQTLDSNPRNDEVNNAKIAKAVVPEDLEDAIWDLDYGRTSLRKKKTKELFDSAGLNTFFKALRTYGGKSEEDNVRSAFELAGNRKKAAKYPIYSYLATRFPEVVEDYKKGEDYFNQKYKDALYPIPSAFDAAVRGLAKNSRNKWGYDIGDKTVSEVSRKLYDNNRDEIDDQLLEYEMGFADEDIAIPNEEIEDELREIHNSHPGHVRDFLMGMLGPRVEKTIETKPEQILEDPKMPEEAKEEAAQVLDSDNRTDEANNEQVEDAVEKLTEDFDTVDDLYNYLDQFGDEYGFVEEPDNKTFDEGQMISESNLPEETIPDEIAPEDETIVDYDYSDIPDPDILSQDEVQQIAFDSIQSDETLDDTTRDQLLDDVASEIDWLVGLGKAKPKADAELGQEWLDKASKADAYMMGGATADEALDMANLEDEISSNISFDPNIVFGENNVDVIDESIEQEPDPEKKARKLRLAQFFRSKANDVGGSGVRAVTQAPTTPEDRRRSVGGSFGGFKPIMSSLGLGYSSGSVAGTTPTQPKQQETTRNLSSGRSNLLDRGTDSGSAIKAGSVGANSSNGNKTFNGGLFGSGSTQKSSKLSKGSVRLPSGGGHTAPAGGGKLAKGKETLSGRKSTGDLNIDKLISMIVSDSKSWPVNKKGNKDSEDRFAPFKLQITEENQILVMGSGLGGAHFETAVQKNPELLKAVKAYFAG